MKGSRARSTRDRALILIAIISGSGAAALFWENRHRPAPLDDENARKVGFRSAAEMEAFDAAELKLMKDEVTPEGCDNADFEFLKQTLAKENQRATIRTVINLGLVSIPTQRRRVLTILGSRRIPKIERGSWSILFRRWSQSPNDKSIIPDLLGSSNPDVVSIATEAKDAEQ